MEYHLENKIMLSEESDYRSLYSWSLQEFNNEGEKIGGDQVPWLWSLYFTASELYHFYPMGVNADQFEIMEGPSSEQEYIRAILHSDDEVKYSMFGTNRIIKTFALHVRKLKKDGANKCCMYGGISCTSEGVNFSDETQDDWIEIYLYLSPQQFDKIAELIKCRSVDMLQLRLYGVSGFYSEWSPSIRTSMIKMLAASKAQEVIMREGCEINLFRLAEVSECELTVKQHLRLDSRRDLRETNKDTLFEDSDKNEKDLDGVREGRHSKDSLLPAKFSHNEAALSKLLIPVWLIVIILFVKFMF